MSSLALVTGCSTINSNPPENNETIRVETTTAPTDLQLICAAKTAEKYKADQDTTLPIGSADVGDGTFSVNVKMGGKQAVCIIDNDGKIVSIEDALPG